MTCQVKDFFKGICISLCVHTKYLSYKLTNSCLNRLSESDKDKLLIKKRVEEKKLRQEGKVRELDELIKLLPEVSLFNRT